MFDRKAAHLAHVVSAVCHHFRVTDETQLVLHSVYDGSFFRVNIPALLAGSPSGSEFNRTSDSAVAPRDTAFPFSQSFLWNDPTSFRAGDATAFLLASSLPSILVALNAPAAALPSRIADAETAEEFNEGLSKSVLQLTTDISRSESRLVALADTTETLFNNSIRAVEELMRNGVRTSANSESERLKEREVFVENIKALTSSLNESDALFQVRVSLLRPRTVMYLILSVL